MKRYGLFLLILTLLLPGAAGAQDAPAVYGIFFYSPSCSHCHIVLDDHWPGISEEFGDQLRVIFVDVSNQQGSAIMNATRSALNIQSSGVPMLVIGEEVLIGSVDIPRQTPVLVRDGLAAGGIAPPPVPGIEPIFEQVFADVAVSAAAPPEVATSQGFASDPVANSIAVAILVGLVASLGLVGWQFVKPSQLLVKTEHTVLALLAVVGAVLAFTLVLGSLDTAWVALLAFVIALIFGGVAALVFSRRALIGDFPTGLLVLLSVAGLGVAAYLAYVEITLTEAVCGTVGNCNAVQQSEYAQLFGVPIAVWGIAAYALILLLVGLRKFGGQQWLDNALLAVAAAGVAFSAYLTFLEPFVIGASCVWCLTSAVIMLMMLWLVAPVSLERARS